MEPTSASSQKPLSILISGAGVAGASLALILARHPSFKTRPIITLIESSTSTRTTGQAIDIRGPGVDVIRQLGLESTIKACHTTETGLAIVNAQGNIVGRFDASGDAKQQSATSEYEILRAELVGLLLDRVNEAKEAGAQINIVHGESIKSTQNVHDGVQVEFSSGKLQPQTFHVVLGADGVASKTRSLMFGKNDARKPSGQYIAFFTIPRVPGDDELWRYCVLPGGLSVHLRPHRNKQTMGAYLAITNPTKTPNPDLEAIVHADIAVQKDYLRKRFQGVCYLSDRITSAIPTSDDFYMTHWCQVVTHRWTQGHCAILGDAAFATMGIGTSFALLSAYIIAGELSTITSPEQVPAALEKYQTVFEPYVRKAQSESSPLPQLISPQTKWGVWVLHTVVRMVVALKVPKLIMWLAGWLGKEDWKLPEYGWEN